MKKGFTLIELLAVIVILAVISLIAVPRIMDAIDDSRAGALRQNNEAVIKAAQNYFVDNAIDLPQVIGETTEVSLEDLIQNDLINEISSPYSSNNCSGYVLVTKIQGMHEFVPHLNCFDEINNSSEDGLIAHYKFDNFQESTENYMSVVSWQPWFENLQIGESSEQNVNEGIIRVTRIGEYKYRATVIEDTTYPRLSLTSSFVWPENIPCTISANITDYYEASGTESRLGIGRSSFGGARLHGSGSLGKKEYTYFAEVDRTGTISIRSNNSLITAGTYIEWEFLQVEFGKTYATPFVDGVREGLVKDFSLNNNHGLSIGNPVPSQDRFGANNKSIKLDGENDYIEIPNYNLNNDATISIWLNTPRSVSSQIIIGDHNSISLGIHGTNYLIGFASQARARGNITNCFSNNEWNHLAVVVENNETKYYCNGIEIPTASNNNWGWNPSDFAYIGRRTPERDLLPYYYEGNIDNLRIYSRPLNDFEIMQLYLSNH